MHSRALVSLSFIFTGPYLGLAASVASVTSAARRGHDSGNLAMGARYVVFDRAVA